VARPGRAKPKPSLSLAQRRFVILAVIVALALWGLSRAFAITDVEVSAQGRGEELKASTKKLLAESWLQGNTITLNNGDLEERLLQEDPLLRSVEVRRKWFHTVRVAAVLKQPSMGWASDNQKYLVDRDGTAIGELPADSRLPVVQDGSNLPVKLGQRVASSRFVDYVGDLIPALKALGITPKAMDVKETTFDLHVTTEKGYKLIMDTSRPVEEGTRDLKAVQALLTSQKKTPAEYIDLRIAGKAYYK
jgi:cell division septal protein FtsQ